MESYTTTTKHSTDTSTACDTPSIKVDIRDDWGGSPEPGVQQYSACTLVDVCHDDGTNVKTWCTFRKIS